MQALVARFRIAVPRYLPEAQKEIRRNEFYDRYWARFWGAIPQIRTVRLSPFAMTSANGSWTASVRSQAMAQMSRL